MPITRFPVSKLLSTLEARFHAPAGRYLHPGIHWDNVRASLQTDRRALWKILQMDAAGHEPDVYHEDERRYYVGTCCSWSPLSARGCVYDYEAVNSFQDSNPQKRYNWNAVGMASAMGIALMSRDHYFILQQKGTDFDQNSISPSSSWLLTPADIRRGGEALIGFRCEDEFFAVPYDVRTSTRKLGWRGSLSVGKV
jgi:hypothetical protein